MSEPATDDVEVKGQKLLSSPASYYAQLLPKLREIAASHGYALAVHGSLTRDCDLVAVPWQEWATDSLTLVKAIKAETGGFFHSPDSAWERLVENGDPTAKPHGRLSYSIHLTERGMDGPYLDVSVMPRATIPARAGSGSNASSLPETEKTLEEKEPSTEAEHVLQNARDTIVEAVRAKLLQRSERGITKYGVTVADAVLSREQWLVHAQEEALDHYVYLERIINNEH